MFRKLWPVAFAAAFFGAAVAPTPAAAWGLTTDIATAGGVRASISAPRVSYGYGSCYVRELRPTPWGPRWRLVNRCY